MFKNQKRKDEFGLQMGRVDVNEISQGRANLVSM